MEYFSNFCIKCKEEKELGEFRKNNQKKKGVCNVCKKCSSFKKDVILDEKEKVCKKCNLSKSISLFRGNYSICKKCKYEKDKERVKARVLEPCTLKNKVCNSCKEIKDIENFQKAREIKSGYMGNCKECTRKYQRNYLLKKSPPKIIEKKTKEEIVTARRIRQRERYKNDHKYKMKRSLRNIVKCSLDRFSKGGYKKSERTEEILKCSLEFMISHIEKQFESWMTWDNYGNCETNEYRCSWDIDHIIPISCAKTEEDIYLLNHWSNLQPLCSKVNRDIKKANVYPCSNLELELTIVRDEYSDVFNLQPF